MPGQIISHYTFGGTEPVAQLQAIADADETMRPALISAFLQNQGMLVPGDEDFKCDEEILCRHLGVAQVDLPGNKATLACNHADITDAEAPAFEKFSALYRTMQNGFTQLDIHYFTEEQVREFQALGIDITPRTDQPHKHFSARKRKRPFSSLVRRVG